MNKPISVKEFFVDWYYYGFCSAVEQQKGNFLIWYKYSRKDFWDHTVDNAIHYAESNQKGWEERSVWDCIKQVRKYKLKPLLDYGLRSILYELVYRKKSKKTWEQVCHSYLKRWGWNKKAREHFYSWGEYGFNNKDLHEDNTFQDFLAELHYCSDRMSLDRLFRCQVKFRNAVNNPEVKEDE